MNTPTVLSDCSSRHRHRKKSGSKRAHSVHSDHYEDKHVISPASSQIHLNGRVPRITQLETLEAKMANIEVSLSTTPRRRKSGSLGGKPLREVFSQQQQPQQQQQQTTKDKETTAAHSDAKQQQQQEEEMTVAELPLAEPERRAAELRLAQLREDVEAKSGAIRGLKLRLDGLDITDNIDIRIQQAEFEYQLGREELELLTLLERSRALQMLLERDDHAGTNRDQQTIFSCIEEVKVATLHAVQVEYDAKSPQFGAGPRPRGSGLWLEWALDHTGMRKGDRLLEVNGKLVLTKSKEDMLRLLSISPSPAQMVIIRYDPPAPPQVKQSEETSLAQVGPLRAELDALREQAEETKRTKEGLRSDNIRLTHRISYLEEQVADLLGRNKENQAMLPPHKMMTSTVKTQRNVTNISITSAEPLKPSESVHVFQKGPDVKAIVSNLPGLELGNRDDTNQRVASPQSSLSNISCAQIDVRKKTSDSEQSTKKIKLYPPSSNHAHYRHYSNKGRYSLQPSKSSDVIIAHSEDDADLSKDRRQYALRQSMSHHSIYNGARNFDYNAETSAAIEIIKNNQRQYSNMNVKTKQTDDQSDASKSSSRRKSSKYSLHKEVAMIIPPNDDKSVQSFSFSDKWPHYPSNDEYGDFHPDRDYIDHRIDGKVIQNRVNRRLLKIQSRHGKLSDCDSEPVKITNNIERCSSSSKLIDYTSEPNGITNGYSKKNNQYSDRPRPLPPKKPVRLSLHRAQSMQTIEPSDSSTTEKFYLHRPNERNNEQLLRYSLTKNIIDDMVGYNKENRDKDPDERRLKQQSKNFSKSEELMEYRHLSLSDREPSEGKRIKKRSHETRSSSLMNSEESNYYKAYSARSESVASSVTNHIHPKSESSSPSKPKAYESHKDDVIINANDKYDYPTKNTPNEKNKTSFKWSHPTVLFKNIRIDSGSKIANGNSNSNYNILKK